MSILSFSFEVFDVFPFLSEESNTICKLLQKKTKVRRPGVEPGSTAWKATMLTVTPPTHSVILLRLQSADYRLPQAMN